MFYENNVDRGPHVVPNAKKYIAGNKYTVSKLQLMYLFMYLFIICWGLNQEPQMLDNCSTSEYPQGVTYI